MIQNEFITLLLAEFRRILQIPYNGQSVFTNEWDLASLSIFQEPEGPYHTELPTPDEIHRFLQFQRIESNRTIKRKNVILSPNQILTKELRQDMKRWEELICENVFRLGGHRDHLSACLTHMLYCIIAEEQYNLAYFFTKRIESARATLTANLPYRIQTRKPQSDRGIQKARHSVSSSSAHHFGSSSHQGNDDDDEGTFRASTSSPNSFLNSLLPLTHQTYDIPTSSQQNENLLFEQQTTLLNQTQQLHEEIKGGFKSFRKALRGVFGKKKK
ncbi:hypothetical protein Tco_0222020 [Tanacetum coccineum]